MPLETTKYIVRVYNETITCYDTASVKVIVWSLPTANAGPDKFTYDQRPVLLLGRATGDGISYSWSPSTYLNNPLAIMPQATPLQTTTYKLTVTSNYGCGTATDEVIVKVIDSLLIPTAFTPNNDGLNDTWEIITFRRYPDATVDVYNRWGQRVYNSTGNNYKPWDGKFEGQLAQPGAYVYFIRLKKNSGILKGMLNIIE
jgi:gliding motility-associated-like protein